MILDEIAEKTKQRVAGQEAEVTLSEMRAAAERLDKNTGFPFRKALAGSELSFICEVKKASPSKGVIAEDFPYLDIAREYEAAGAAAISCLTEPYWFRGSNTYLREISAAVNIPVLRKDFTVSEYMIYEAKTLGAADILQLHGSEDAEYIARLRKLTSAPLIKAVKVISREDIIRADELDVDFLLLDGGTGSGMMFDHALVDPSQIRKPFFLAGGLTPENIAEAAERIRPYGVDLSSGIETDRLKDREKILAAVKNIRNN